MEYEWSIACYACGCLKSQGGFSVPQNLTNEQVLQNVEHNPGCLVPTAPLSAISITSASDSQNANVMRSSVSLAGIEQ